MNRTTTNKIALISINVLASVAIIVLCLILGYLTFRGFYSSNEKLKTVTNEVNESLDFDVYVTKDIKLKNMDYFTLKDIFEGYSRSWRTVADVNEKIKVVVDPKIKSIVMSYFNLDELNKRVDVEDLSVSNAIEDGTIYFASKDLNLKGMKTLSVQDQVIIVNKDVTKIVNNKKIKSLKDEDVNNLMTGNIKNWSEIQGKDFAAVEVSSLSAISSTPGAYMLSSAQSYDKLSSTDENVAVLNVIHTEKKVNLTLSYLFSKTEESGNFGGIATIILNTFIMIILTGLFATPLGIGAAIYLVLYAKKGRLTEIIEGSIDLLAAVPSIIFGLFGMLIFVQWLGLSFSLISGTLTLALMILPTIIRTSEEAIRGVDKNLIKASHGLGATKIETIIKVVIPAASRSITTGVVLALGRALGETAALVFTIGSSTDLVHSLTSSSRVLAQHIYLTIIEGQSMDKAFSSSFVLLVLILLINTVTKLLINKKDN